MKKLMIIFLTILCVNHAFALNSTRLITGLAQPLLVTHAPNDFERIFILERVEARIRIFSLTGDSLHAAPFLDIDSLVHNSGGERGLLGLAFHPDYENNGYFYVNYTNNSGHTVVARYTVSPTNPDSALASSAFILMTIYQPFSNHNGGGMAFGPNDGYLYIGLGDGGDANDPGERAQNPDSLLGKMLRIDVDNQDEGLNYAIPESNPYYGGESPRPEIWASGLRNPWRWSFDRATGDLYIADVGQGAREEVNFQSDSSAGGENYGWDCMEGTNCIGGDVGCVCNDPDLTLPVSQYPHTGGNCSITGGYVYRGCAIPEIVGHYFYADYCTGQIWSWRWNGVQDVDSMNRTADLVPDVGTIGNIASFGEDAYGELYICDISGGEVFKIIPDNMTDCNSNNIADSCDIVSGFSDDDNQNGVPDECEISPCDSVTNLSVSVDEQSDAVTLYWTANGDGSETYVVWRSGISQSVFPDQWEIIAGDLPHVAGENAMSYTDTISESDTLQFYLVTAECP